MIVCSRCGKENQAHYKFCLGCGSELPRDAQVSSEPKSQTPSSGMRASQPGVEDDPSPAGAQPQERTSPGSSPAPAGSGPPAPISGETVVCPSCGEQVPSNFKFCGSCGHRMVGAPAAGGAAAAPSPAAGGSRGSLVLINPDGTEGARFGLGDGATYIGRDAGDIFAGDSYLSPTHASFRFEGDMLRVKDEDSLNGVYVQIPREQAVPLDPGDVFRIGQELIRFDAIEEPKVVEDVELMGSPNPGYIGRVGLVVGRHALGNVFPIPPEGIHIGRERGDVLFPEDGYVSGLHCRIHNEGGRTVLVDVGSSNGTFVRVAGQRALRNGELILMGQQLFRIEY